MEFDMAATRSLDTSAFAPLAHLVVEPVWRKNS
jgi:hypothetical protein